MQTMIVPWCRRWTLGIECHGRLSSGKGQLCDDEEDGCICNATFIQVALPFTQFQHKVLIIFLHNKSRNLPCLLHFYQRKQPWMQLALKHTTGILRKIVIMNVSSRKQITYGKFLSSRKTLSRMSR